MKFWRYLFRFLQILQVTAVDLDTGNNARLTYKLIPSSNISSAAEEVEVFGIFPNSGWIYVRSSLDREHRDRYDFFCFLSGDLLIIIELLQLWIDNHCNG